MSNRPRRPFSELLQRTLATLDQYPAEYRKSLRCELEQYLADVETKPELLEPPMIQAYARAIYLFLEWAKAGTLQLERGLLARFARASATVDRIMESDRTLTPEQALERYVDSGERIDVAEPSKDSFRGPSGRA